MSWSQAIAQDQANQRRMAEINAKVDGGMMTHQEPEIYFSGSGLLDKANEFLYNTIIKPFIKSLKQGYAKTHRGGSKAGAKAQPSTDYYSFGSYELLIPKKMVIVKGFSESKPYDAFTKTEQFKKMKVDDESIRSVRFVINPNITKPKELHRGLEREGNAVWGSIVIEVPAETLLIHDVKGKKTYSLYDTLTKTGLIKKAGDLKSIKIRPTNVSKVEVVKMPTTDQVPASKKIDKKDEYTKAILDEMKNRRNDLEKIAFLDAEIAMNRGKPSNIEKLEGIKRTLTEKKPRTKKPVKDAPAEEEEPDEEPKKEMPKKEMPKKEMPKKEMPKKEMPEKPKEEPTEEEDKPVKRIVQNETWLYYGDFGINQTGYKKYYDYLSKLFSSPGKVSDAEWARIQEARKGFFEGQTALDYFPTPKKVVDRIMKYINDTPYLRRQVRDCHMLEPSAGTGSIIRGFIEHFGFDAHSIHANEYNKNNILKELLDGVKITTGDFLHLPDNKLYDLIIMNPPFNAEGRKDYYMEHLVHGLNLLGQGGAMIALCPAFHNLDNQLDRAVANQPLKSNSISQLLEDSKKMTKRMKKALIDHNEVQDYDEETGDISLRTHQIELLGTTEGEFISVKFEKKRGVYSLSPLNMKIAIYLISVP